MSKNNSKIEHPTLFLFALIFLILSVGFVIFGIIKKDPSEQIASPSKISQEISEETKDEESISEYFEDVQLSNGKQGIDSYYLEKDPFRNECSAEGGGYGTICYY